METTERNITVTEMRPTGSKYLTQSADVEDVERLFLTSRIKLPNEDGTEWREATAEEVAAHDAQVAADEERARILAGGGAQ